MNLNDLALFRGLQSRIQHLTAQQKVIAENIANANTPGYRAQAVAPFNFKDALKRTTARDVGAELHRTDPRHMAGLLRPATFETDAAENTPMGVTGNSVDLETEIAKGADTALQHQLVSNLYRKHVGLLRTALGRTGNS